VTTVTISLTSNEVSLLLKVKARRQQLETDSGPKSPVFLEQKGGVRDLKKASERVRFD
jgi:hypothetical protein